MPPGYKATVLDAFAWTDGTPAAINAGRLTNDPPPARAFIAPAINPAQNTRKSEFMLQDLPLTEPQGERPSLETDENDAEDEKSRSCESRQIGRMLRNTQ